MARAAGRKANGLRCIAHRHRPIQILIGPLDDLAHAPIRLGGAHVSCDTRGNFAPCRHEFSDRISRVLERGLEKGRRISDLLSAQLARGLSLQELRESAARSALRLDEEQRDQSLRFEGMRRVGRNDSEGSTYNLVFKMEAEITAQRKRQLVRMV